MKRRDFLKASVAVSALVGLQSTNATAQSTPVADREFYELRLYRLKEGADHALLDGYLEKAAIPALNRLGIKPIGAFTEPAPKDGPGIYVLIPYPSLDVFAATPARLNADPEFLKAGAQYLAVPKASPAFARIDSWIMRAFAGLPKLELPPYCREKKARIFELRTYESHSEAKAQNKVDMFNAGEIDTMKEVGLAPIFYGQTLAGRDMPHLIYMTSAESSEAHKKHWDGFGKHPVWAKLKSDPQYADNTSKITSQMLEPTAYSQI